MILARVGRKKVYFQLLLRSSAFVRRRLAEFDSRKNTKEKVVTRIRCHTSHLHIVCVVPASHALQVCLKGCWSLISPYIRRATVRVTWVLRIYGERRCGTSTNHLGDGAAHSGFTEWTVKLSAGLLAALSDTV